MPAALAMSIRQEIVKRREKGESLANIAREKAISYGATRKIWRQYVKEGSLEPHYDKCRQTGIRKEQALYEMAIALKAAHPGWGAGLIRVELSEQLRGHDLPSERTLQRWFGRGGVAKALRRDKKAVEWVKRGEEAHEVWAIDAKEQIRLRDGSYVSWLTISDEGSGAVLSVVLFPHTPLDEG